MEMKPVIATHRIQHLGPGYGPEFQGDGGQFGAGQFLVESRVLAPLDGGWTAPQPAGGGQRPDALTRRRPRWTTPVGGHQERVDLLVGRVRWSRPVVLDEFSVDVDVVLVAPPQVGEAIRI